MEQEVETMETAELLTELISFTTWMFAGYPGSTMMTLTSEERIIERWDRHRKVEAEINKRIPRPELPDDR
jgi:hypothetical protein